MAEFNLISSFGFFAKLVLIGVFAKFVYTELDPLYKKLKNNKTKTKVTVMKCTDCGTILQLIKNRRLCPVCDKVD